MAGIDAIVNFNPRSEQQFAAACRAGEGNHEVALVAVRDDSICGYIVFSQVLDQASVHSIAVALQCQREGLGQLLLDAALAQMRTAGATRCLLEVRQSNAAARALYEGSHFRLDGLRKNYYPAPGGREDALLMSKELQG
jgi:ribosomal-protein-alanine N-acetyltransferase